MMNNKIIRLLLITNILFLWSSIPVLANISENGATKNVLLVKIHVKHSKNFVENQEIALNKIIKILENKITHPFIIREYTKGCDKDSLLGIITIGYSFGKHIILEYASGKTEEIKDSNYSDKIKYKLNIFTELNNGMNSNWESYSTKYEGYDDYYLFEEIPDFEIIENSYKLIQYSRSSFFLNIISAKTFNLYVEGEGQKQNFSGGFDIGLAYAIQHKLPYKPTFGIEVGGAFTSVAGANDKVTYERSEKYVNSQRFENYLEETKLYGLSYYFRILYSIPLNKIYQKRYSNCLCLSVGPTFGNYLFSSSDLRDSDLNKIEMDYNYSDLSFGLSYIRDDILFNSFSWGFYFYYILKVNRSILKTDSDLLPYKIDCEPYFKIGFHIGPPGIIHKLK